MSSSNSRLNVSSSGSPSNVEGTIEAMENVLAVLAGEWSAENEVAGSNIDLVIGSPTSSASDSSIQISEPGAYNRMVRQEFPDGPLKKRALSFEGPYHEMFEEAAHFISRQFEHRDTNSYEDVVANELIGGLGISTFDPEIISWEVGRIRDNIEAVTQMNSDSELEYVNDNIDDFGSRINRYVRELDQIDSEDELHSFVGDVLEERGGALSDLPSRQKDFDYSRTAENAPKTYSEWFLDDVVYGFVKPLANEKDADLEKRLRASKKLAEDAADKIAEYQDSSMTGDRDRKLIADTAHDRGYFVGRNLSVNGTEGYQTEDILRMDNQDIYDEFRNEALEFDRQIREETGMPGPLDR